MRTGKPRGLATGLVLLLGVAAAPLGAQGKFPPDKFVNLQVLPKDADYGTVIQAMKSFTRGLGVRCQFCHIGEEGLPLEQFDFVTDTDRKRKARVMLRMVGEINARLAEGLPDVPAERRGVTCFTCHRGQEKPVHMPQ